MNTSKPPFALAQVSEQVDLNTLVQLMLYTMCMLTHCPSLCTWVQNENWDLNGWGGMEKEGGSQ